MNLKVNKTSKFSTTKLINQSDKKKILINVFLYYGLRFFVIIYAIIRLYLINVYLGVANLGLLNIMMLIAPISLFLITTCQYKSNFILYKYSLKKDYAQVNRIINEQIKEMRIYALISIIFLGGVMAISYFFVNSPGINHFTSCLLVFSNSIGTLSYGLVLPYVAWYLNSIYLNYINDFWEISFATILNIVVFIIIPLFGIHVIQFPNTSYEQSATYITLIIAFLLSVRFLLVNIVLNWAKKKYMPWFKRDLKVKIQLFSKNNLGYILQEFLATLAMSLIPLIFFIFTTFIHLTTSISGIYYSYINFVLIIGLLSWIVAAVKPYLAKFMLNNTKIDIYKLNQILSFIFIYIGTILLINFVIVSPYIMVFVKSYFNFWLAFLIGMCSFISCVKSIDEAFIYLDGKPEKYWRLTIYEIITGVISLVVAFCVIFLNDSFKDNVINILYGLIFSEMFMRFAKYIFNIIYLNKHVYNCSVKRFIRDYWSIYVFAISSLIFIICTLALSPYISQTQGIFTTNVQIPIYSYANINSLFIDNISIINFGNLFLSLILVNAGFIIATLLIIKYINKSFKQNILNILNLIKLG